MYTIFQSLNISQIVRVLITYINWLRYMRNVIQLIVLNILKSCIYYFYVILCYHGYLKQNKTTL